MTHTFIRELAAAGALAPSADNGQPTALRWDGRELALHFVQRHPEYNVFGPASHATLLSVGAVMENLAATLQANGVAGAWRWGGPDGLPYAAVALADLPAALTVPPAVTGRHTNRAPYRRDAVPSAVLAKVEGLSEGKNRIAVLADKPRKSRLVGLVRSCSEARFCSQELHAWLMGSLRKTPDAVAQGDGLDMACLGLPPGGRQMLNFIASWQRMSWLNSFGAYKLLALSETGLIGAAPALLCLTGPADWRSTLEAGRLLTRAWSVLNAQGLAVHPYYVVSDQINRLHDGGLAPGFASQVSAAEAAVQDLLALPAGHVLHMILRIGQAKQAVPRSRRLPLDAVFSDVSGA